MAALQQPPITDVYAADEEPRRELNCLFQKTDEFYPQSLTQTWLCRGGSLHSFIGRMFRRLSSDTARFKATGWKDAAVSAPVLI